jgi:uncharacterized repeat protein (TIGR03803 family)
MKGIRHHIDWISQRSSAGARLTLSLVMLLTSAAVATPTAQGQLSYLYNFGNFPTDGVYPGVVVQWTDGSFWGTTYQGGAFGPPAGCGTVFSVNITGGEGLSSSFNCVTATFGFNGLAIGEDGNLYGTTEYGGSGNCQSGCFTVFRTTPSGVITVIATPLMPADGNDPSGPLVVGPGGDLYEDSYSGGSADLGVIFKVSLQGTYTTLADLSGPPGPDNPWSGLVLGNNGILYGGGHGGPNTCILGGCGELFNVTASGVVTTLFAFSSPKDGYVPLTTPVLAKNGDIYGTTEYGGTNGDGVIYKLTAQGQYQVLYNIDSGSGGVSSLSLANDGNLYGTTALSEGVCPPTCETVFRLTPDGVLTTVATFNQFNFNGSLVYANPYGLIQGTNGNLYGTTHWGGVSGNEYLNGAGTMFEVDLGLKPIPPVVSGFSPTSGPVGTKVTVKGTYFVQVESVKFGAGASATPTVITPSELTVVVPSGAQTGPLRVTTAVGSGKSKNSFTVN